MVRPARRACPRGLRGQIQLMGGGLVELAGNSARNHYEWMKWIART